MPEPLSLMALGIQMIAGSPAGYGRRWDHATAASITWSAKASSPTGSVSSINVWEQQTQAPVSFSEDMVPSLGWATLAQAVLEGSRPMQDWERQSLDAFTWAELEA